METATKQVFSHPLLSTISLCTIQRLSRIEEQREPCVLSGFFLSKQTKSGSKEVFLHRHGVLHVFTSSKAECLEFDKLLQICYTELATDFETLTDILFLMSNFFPKVRQTSHKPDEIYGVIERLAPGTRKIGENSSSLHVYKKIQTY